MSRTYTSVEAMRIARITYRQLDHWCTYGLFGEERRGAGSGNRRPPYTAEDVVVMGALARVSAAFAEVDRRNGASVVLLRQIAQIVREGDWDATVQMSRHVELSVSVGDLWQSVAGAPAEKVATS
jgi:hypothetical protein